MRLADVVARPVEYLWDGRIAYGFVTLLVGDPGMGKSFVAIWIATAVTSGVALPADERARQSADVVMANYEDPAAETIRPRADQSGFGPGDIWIWTKTTSLPRLTWNVWRPPWTSTQRSGWW